MSEPRIGRLVVAALHESLAARLSFRVEFYDHWLQPPRLKSGTIGMASFLAVLSFLRQEGPIYDTIVADAGRYAADWVYADASMMTRLRWRWLPRGRRFRAALRLTRQLSADATPGTRCRIRWRRSAGRVHLDDSPFCFVRSCVASPLCGFYGAALARFCELLGVAGDVQHETCRGMGGSECVLTLAPAQPAIAAATSKPGVPA